jgi:hypothetical protein
MPPDSPEFLLSPSLRQTSLEIFAKTTLTASIEIILWNVSRDGEKFLKYFGKIYCNTLGTSLGEHGSLHNFLELIIYLVDYSSKPALLCVILAIVLS